MSQVLLDDFDPRVIYVGDNWLHETSVMNPLVIGFNKTLSVTWRAGSMVMLSFVGLSYLNIV